MRRIFILSLLLVMTLGLQSCKKGARTLYGDWILENRIVNGVSQNDNPCMTLQLRKGKTFRMNEHTCFENTFVAISNGTWDVIDYKSNLQMTYTQSTSFEANRQGVWDWRIDKIEKNSFVVRIDEMNGIVQLKFRRLE